MTHDTLESPEENTLSRLNNEIVLATIDNEFVFATTGIEYRCSLDPKIYPEMKLLLHL